MICIADRCGQNSRHCPCPERCGMLNEVREMRIYLEEEMQAVECTERWARRAFVALVIGLAVWAVVINWPTVLMVWAIN